MLVGYAVHNGQKVFSRLAERIARNCEGLAKTYNRFHDPDECDPDILALRQMHSQMDRAVLAAYGWADIPTAASLTSRG